MSQRQNELRVFEMNAYGVMTFTLNVSRLLFRNPERVGSSLVPHGIRSQGGGSGYIQFIRNYAVVMLLSYFEHFKKVLGFSFRRIERLATNEEWQTFNEFKWARNCIVHNKSQVDEKYLENVPGANKQLGEAILPSTGYLQTNYRNLLAISAKMASSSES